MKKLSLTTKKITFGNNRSKALNATRRTWKLNLQKYRFLDQDQKTQTVYLTVREIRTLRRKSL